MLRKPREYTVGMAVEVRTVDEEVVIGGRDGGEGEIRGGIGDIAVTRIAPVGQAFHEGGGCGGGSGSGGGVDGG
ncbi:hypothetical protein L1987_28743 [Smallanthus sonchifolius]|uniref:Uncharacterized protein n=1 Tax=Smallanthus sonchifolius TaxID=185202 RepID=A0ACB9HXJ6_9ASTR|nr:hypothetical protein L1987_28743 [Smallanthus sonchifolius]